MSQPFDKPSPIDEEMARAGHDAYEAKSRALGYESRSPVPWDLVPEPIRQCTLAAYEAVILVHEKQMHQRLIKFIRDAQ